MKIFIVCLLLGALVGVTPPPVSPQQNQTSQQSAQEIEDLKKRVSELEKQLKIVENIEKMALAKNYTDVKAKLIDAEFGKFERELRDTNDEQMREWGVFFLTIVSALGIAFWFGLKSLIANNVEKHLSGFKEGLKELEIQKNQFRESEKENAAYRLEEIVLENHRRYPRDITVLRDEALLDVFDDEEYDLELRYKAAHVLVSRQSQQVIFPILGLLNLTVDSDAYVDFEAHRLRDFVDLLGRLHMQACYQGLREFLNRLITENPKHKDLLLTETVCSFARVSASLDVKNSVSILRRAIPHFENASRSALVELAEHLDILNEPMGIKEILTVHDQNLPSDVKDKCLELLEKHDSEFVKNWRARHTTDYPEP